MPPKLSGTRVPIGGGSVGGGGDMRQASKGSGFGASGSKDTRTFKGGQGGGAAVKNTIMSQGRGGAGGPEQKGGTSVGSAKKPPAGNWDKSASGQTPHTKSVPGKGGLFGTVKQGSNLSSKPQPMRPGAEMQPSKGKLT